MEKLPFSFDAESLDRSAPKTETQTAPAFTEAGVTAADGKCASVYDNLTNHGDPAACNVMIRDLVRALADHEWIRMQRTVFCLVKIFDERDC